MIPCRREHRNALRRSLHEYVVRRLSQRSPGTLRRAPARGDDLRSVARYSPVVRIHECLKLGTGTDIDIQVRTRRHGSGPLDIQKRLGRAAIKVAIAVHLDDVNLMTG